MTTRTFAVVLVCILATIFVSHFQGQGNAIPQVYVANPASRPVPAAIQGTTAISGSVNVTNTSLPVNGTVAVSNLPLDANGNVRQHAQTADCAELSGARLVVVPMFRTESGASHLPCAAMEYCDERRGARFVTA